MSASESQEGVRGDHLYDGGEVVGLLVWYGLRLIWSIWGKGTVGYSLLAQLVDRPKSEIFVVTAQSWESGSSC